MAFKKVKAKLPRGPDFDAKAEAVRMYQEGKSCPEIARAFNVSRCIARTWIETSGIKVRSNQEQARLNAGFTEEVKTKLQTLVDSGLPTVAIAARLGVDRRQVVSWYKYAGIERTRTEGMLLAFEPKREQNWADLERFYAEHKLRPTQNSNLCLYTFEQLRRQLEPHRLEALMSAYGIPSDKVETKWEALEAFYLAHKRQPSARISKERALVNFVTGRRRKEPERLASLMRACGVTTVYGPAAQARLDAVRNAE